MQLFVFSLDSLHNLTSYVLKTLGVMGFCPYSLNLRQFGSIWSNTSICHHMWYSFSSIIVLKTRSVICRRDIEVQVSDFFSGKDWLFENLFAMNVSIKYIGKYMNEIGSIYFLWPETPNVRRLCRLIFLFGLQISRDL